MKQLAALAVSAAWAYLRSNAARKLEMALISGLLTAILKVVH